MSPSIHTLPYKSSTSPRDLIILHSGTKTDPFYRILEQGQPFSRVVGANRTRLKGFCPFGMLLDQGRTPFKGPFQCVTLGIVSKGKKPSCLWMLPFGPWVLPFGPRVFPIDVLHLPLAPCNLSCGPWILPSNHWFWPTVLGSLVHIKANEKHQAAVPNTRCQRMPSRPKSPPPCRKSTPPFEMLKGPPLSKDVGARPSL